jgi:hypothetical protein
MNFSTPKQKGTFFNRPVALNDVLLEKNLATSQKTKYFNQHRTGSVIAYS